MKFQTIQEFTWIYEFFTIVFFKSFLIQSDQTRHLNITAQRPQFLEFDHTRWCCRDCNNAVASTSQLGGVDEEDEDEDEAWQLGCWLREGRCDANILGPWHVRDTKTWSRRSGLPICMSKKMWNEKTQAAHAGNSLLMSSSNPRPSKKIAAKYPLIQKDPERLSWASLSQTKQSEITTIGQTSTNTTLVSCS